MGPCFKILDTASTPADGTDRGWAQVLRIQRGTGHLPRSGIFFLFFFHVRVFHVRDFMSDFLGENYLKISHEGYIGYKWSTTKKNMRQLIILNTT